MARKTSRSLVIDASIARAAGGEDAAFPTSKHCRDFLKHVLRICHRMVLTPTIKKEWKKHHSTFARRWWASMEARKKVDRPDVTEDADLRDALEKSATSDKDWLSMEKDAHLLEAAMAADRVVVSLDDVVRNLFQKAAKTVGAISNVAWVNPTEEDDQAVHWLEAGAKSERDRRLG